MDENGVENNDVFVIHRAPLSTHERFMAFLIEHYAGAFPLWMSPVQVSVIPVSDKHLEMAEKAYRILKEKGIRAELRNEQKSVSYKIRQTALQKVPYAIIIGDNEVEASSGNDVFVTPRLRDGKDLEMQSIYSLLESLNQQIENRQ
jgi:threonyl-tRNA synthetase